MSGLQGLIDIAFYAIVGLALSVAGFFFVMGVISYMGAGGDQQKVQQGVAGMRNALIGAVLIGGASLIINFVVLDIVRPAGGEVGNIGVGLDCDNLLQQQMLSSPLSTANADNANAVIAGIRAQRPSDCPPDTWNPLVTGTAGTGGFDVNVPPTLAEGGAAGTGEAFDNTPWRDNLGNIGIDFEATGDARGSPVTLPLDRGTRWMYLANQGVWYAAN